MSCENLSFGNQIDEEQETDANIRPGCVKLHSIEQD
jgi:hypothetical protein